MSDLYAEVLVKRQQTAKDHIIRVGLILVTALAVVAGFLMPLLFLAAAALAAACYFLIPRTDLEYEYLFVNGELDVDVIMGKSKRKRLKSFSMQTVEVIAPLDSHRVDYYKNNTQMKTIDYSSGTDAGKRYLMVVSDGDDGAVKVILEPGEELAEFMKKSAPSKVFLD